MCNYFSYACISERLHQDKQKKQKQYSTSPTIVEETNMFVQCPICCVNLSMRDAKPVRVGAMDNLIQMLVNKLPKDEKNIWDARIMLHASKLQDIAVDAESNDIVSVDHVEFEMEIPEDEREDSKMIVNGVNSVLNETKSVDFDNDIINSSATKDNNEEMTDEEKEQDDVFCELCGKFGHTEDACDAPGDLYGNEESEEEEFSD